MDALHPRLLVDDFAACFDFYDAVLPDLIGAVLRKGSAAGPYANWDVEDQGALVLFDRGAMAGVVGTSGLPSPTSPSPAPGPASSQDVAMFVCRVADVDTGLALCLKHGATLAVPATDRPEWGPGLRTAHLRDPQGTLIELQAY